jgi:predicted subunit of tRNA(5-methylaminomethyl-2-thiouridylate) methyltransferase
MTEKITVFFNTRKKSLEERSMVKYLSPTKGFLKRGIAGRYSYKESIQPPSGTYRNRKTMTINGRARKK